MLKAIYARHQVSIISKIQKIYLRISQMTQYKKMVTIMANLRRGIKYHIVSFRSILLTLLDLM